MAICGLVITLEGDAQQRAMTLGRLAAEPGITIGDAPDGARVPAVLEADGKGEYLSRWRRIAELEGVAHVDLAYVHYDDSDSIYDSDKGSLANE